MSLPQLVRPELVDPIEYRLPATGYADSDATTIKIPSGRDAVILAPREKRVGHLRIMGGRNKVLAGLYQSIGKNRDGSYPAQGARTMGDYNVEVLDGDPSGIFHAEGVHIDGSEGAQSDGFFLNCPNTIVQLLKCRTDTLLGALRTGRHADGVQTPNGVLLLTMDRSSFGSYYNTLYLRRENSPLKPPILELRVRYCNTFGYDHNPVADPSKGDTTHTLRGISLGTQPADDDGGPGNAASPTNMELETRVTLSHFHTDPESAGLDPLDWVYPHGGKQMYDPARPVYDPITRSLYWPGWRAQGKVTGRVLMYPPTHGDFAKPEAVGLNYRAAMWAD